MQLSPPGQRDVLPPPQQHGSPPRPRPERRTADSLALQPLLLRCGNGQGRFGYIVETSGREESIKSRYLNQAE
eukprot:6212392-Pleurochrysis_carterae.AAC.1